MKEDVRKTVLERKRRAKSKSSKPSGKADLRSKVGDLRSIIAKKTKKKEPTSKDLRDSNKKLSLRKKPKTPTPSSNRKETSRPVTRATRSSAVTGPSGPRQHHQQPEQEYYVPPHIRRSQAAYVAPHAVVPQRTSSVVANPPEPIRSASVLVSNLNPTITQSDIIELFGEIGVMTAVNMVNQNLALVTYQSSSDAFRAVRVYHNRLLDGRPMFVNIMPTPV